MERECSECGSSFDASGRQARKVTCSTECRTAREIRLAAERRETYTQHRTCEVCGTAFTVVGLGHQRRACSPACALELRREASRKYQRANYVQRVNTLPVVKCDTCGESFQQRKGHQIYCSDLCKRRGSEAKKQRNKADRVCMKCGAPVARKPGYPVCDACKVEPKRQRAAYQRKRTLATYGLTLEDFDRMLAEQAGRCAICDTDTPGAKGWCVDHDHDSGAVRGLLCAPCNLAIGYMNDDAARLAAAARYLTKPR